MRKQFNLSEGVISLFVLMTLGISPFVMSQDRGNASDPTAAVNFTDLRLQLFDLGDVGIGDDRDRYVIEGAYAFTPNHKLTYELNYWDTDITGRSQSGLESFKAKYINLTPGQLGNVRYKFAIGAELALDLGDPRDGIGQGVDTFAPLIGAGWNLGEKDLLITLVQYFHSYDEDRYAPGKVRLTGPRLIWIHTLPGRSWLKIDNKFSIDHENGDHSSNLVEIQLGKMLTPTFGIYLDYLNNTGGQKIYDDGIGIGLRFMY